LNEKTITIQEQLSGGSSSWGGFFTSLTATPLAGFWIRAVAFGIDGLLLYAFFIRLLFPLTTGFSLGYPLLPAVIVPFGAIVYFTALNGPLGKGRTPGKHLLGIVTRGPDGTPLSWSASYLRAVIQCLPLIAFAVEGMILHLSTPGAPELETQFAVAALLTIPCIALFGATAASAGMRPDKRGLHDTLFGSFTFKAGRAEEALDFLSAIPLEAIRRSWRVVGVLGLACLGLLEFRDYSFRKDQKEYAQFIDALWAAHSIPGFHLRTLGRIQLDWVREEVTEGNPTPAAPPRTAPAQGGADAAPTSESKTIYLAYPIKYVRYGNVDRQALLETIAQTNLTTGVAQWMQGRWNTDSIPAPILRLRDWLRMNPQVRCQQINVRFVEAMDVLSVLRYPHFKIVHEESFPFDLDRKTTVSLEAGQRIK